MKLKKRFLSKKTPKIKFTTQEQIEIKKYGFPYVYNRITQNPLPHTAAKGFVHKNKN